LDVSNTGTYDGAEVVQLYIRSIASVVDKPVKELKAFKKIFLKKGETQSVHFNIDKNAFAYYHAEKKEWTVDPGKYAIHIGSSSKDIRLTDIIDLK